MLLLSVTDVKSGHMPDFDRRLNESEKSRTISFHKTPKTHHKKSKINQIALFWTTLF